MKTGINQIHKQINRLEREFMFNGNRMKSLSDEGMRGCSEYWRLHEECKGINDTIRELIKKLWKLQDLD